jgi:hypothetical protein
LPADAAGWLHVMCTHNVIGNPHNFQLAQSLPRAAGRIAHHNCQRRAKSNAPPQGVKFGTATDSQNINQGLNFFVKKEKDGFHFHI